jgi:hypothetical protein
MAAKRARSQRVAFGIVAIVGLWACYATIGAIVNHKWAFAAVAGAFAAFQLALTWSLASRGKQDKA